MAAILQDIPQWLLNRLGTSDRTWVDGSIAPYLTKDLLKGVYDCFQDLQTPIKIKLLLSFLHIVRRSVDLLKPELEAIIEMAIQDPDQWVSLTAEFLKYFPSKGEFNLNIIENAEMFNGMRNDIKRHLKRIADNNNELHFIPYEAEFMNKKAFTATFGNTPAPVKHFTLKQKPKSATLRADALAKATDVVKPRTGQVGSSMPIRHKEPNKTLDAMMNPQGIISAAVKRAYVAGPQARVLAAKEKQAVAAKIRGGVKLLDIADQPLGQEVGSKRRRKLVGVPVSGQGDEKDGKDGEKAEDDELGEHHEDADQKPASPSEAEHEKDEKTIEGSPDRIKSPDGRKSEGRAVAPQSPEMPPPLHMPHITSTSAPTLSSELDLTEKVKEESSQPSTSTSPPKTQIIHQSAAVPLVDLKNIKLSKEVQKGITETFANANRVTRPEKILIINFIAGVRDNPCPQLGPILTIRLSEHPTKVALADGRETEMMVEEYFHMNFSTGEWKRLRKNKPMPPKETLSETSSPPV